MPILPEGTGKAIGKVFQMYRLPVPLLDLLNGAAEIVSRDVALDDNTALDTFAHDEIWAAILLNRCNTRKKDARTGGRVEEHLSNAAKCIFLAGPARIPVLGDQREADLAFENPADLGGRGRRRHATGSASTTNRSSGTLSSSPAAIGQALVNAGVARVGS